MRENWDSIYYKIAEIYGKTKESIDSQLIAFDSDIHQSIKLDSFYRGPALTLIVGLTLSIVLYLFEFSKNYVKN